MFDLFFEFVIGGDGFEEIECRVLGEGFYVGGYYFWECLCWLIDFCRNVVCVGVELGL